MQIQRSLPTNIGLLIATLLLFLAGAELIVRVTGLVKMKDYTPPIYERSENPEISYTLKPNIREKAFRNVVTTDGMGFHASSPSFDSCSRVTLSGTDAEQAKRDEAEVETKGDTAALAQDSAQHDTCHPMIVILGDSITFGYGVADDETLPAQLNELMPDSYVINAGIPGYHVAQEVAFYEEKLKPLEPDTLVLIFYWNDFDTKTSWLDEDNVLRAEGWTPSEKQCQPIERGVLGLIPGKCWLDLNSAFYNGVKEFVNTRTAMEERDVKRGEVKESPKDDSTDVDLERYSKELKKLASIAPENRIFVIWPDSEMHTESRPRLKSIAEKYGFAVLDLYDHFGNQMETLSWDYMHPSPKSIREAAEIIRSALAQFFYDQQE